MSGVNLANFLPYETVSLSVSSGSSAVAFKLAGSFTDMSDVMVTNAGSNTAFIGFGDSKGGTVTITAQLPGSGTLNATPILAGQTMVLNKNFMAGKSQADTCAAITASGTTTLYFTSGRGS